MHSGMQIVQGCWIALVVVWAALAFTVKRTRERDTAGSRLRYHLPTFFSYLLMFTPVFWIGGLGKTWIRATPQVEILGVALTALGVALAIWARLYIGRNWSGVVTIKQDHRLIRTGPYAWVRHPIYSGLILAMVGTAVVNRRWAGVLAVLMMAAAFFFKSKVEEGFMRRTFGAEYDLYCRHTGAFLPHF